MSVQVSDQKILEEVRDLANQLLRPNASDLDRTGRYPAEQMRAVAELGLNGMGIDREYGGLGLSPKLQGQILIELAAACTTTAFILGQRKICSSLLSLSENEEARRRWLPELARGSVQAADAVNYLRQPPERAPMRAVTLGDSGEASGYRLNGTMTWVTASHHSDVFVCGAVVEDGRQIVAVVPKDDYAQVTDTVELMAFQASDTAQVVLQDCFVPAQARIHGPRLDVLPEAWNQRGLSAPQKVIMAFLPVVLALGHMRTTVERVRENMLAKGRSGEIVYERTRREVESLTADILAALDAHDATNAVELRVRTNYLIQFVANVALLVAGGTGYRRDSDIQRFFREAAFWSVWSIGSAQAMMLDMLASS